MYQVPNKILFFYLNYLKNHQPWADQKNHTKVINNYWDHCERNNIDKFANKSISHYFDLLVRFGSKSDEINTSREILRLFQQVCREFAPKPAPESGLTWEECYTKLTNLISLKQYSPKTLSSYKVRIRQFENYVNNKSPTGLSAKDAENFLTWLTVTKKVAASTQNVAFNALLFFLLMYGCGLRLSEAVNSRVHNFNLKEWILSVQSGKGDKARALPLPKALKKEIEEKFWVLKALHKDDLKANAGPVVLPKALDSKYKNAGRELAWQC